MLPSSQSAHWVNVVNIMILVWAWTAHLTFTSSSQPVIAWNLHRLFKNEISFYFKIFFRLYTKCLCYMQKTDVCSKNKCPQYSENIGWWMDGWLVQSMTSWLINRWWRNGGKHLGLVCVYLFSCFGGKDGRPMILLEI